MPSHHDYRAIIDRGAREYWPTREDVRAVKLYSLLFEGEGPVAVRAKGLVQLFVDYPPPDSNVELRGAGPLGPAVEYELLVCTISQFQAKGVPRFESARRAVLLVPELSIIVLQHLRGGTSRQLPDLLSDPDAITFGRLNAPLLCAAADCDLLMQRLNDEIGTLTKEVSLVRQLLEESQEDSVGKDDAKLHAEEEGQEHQVRLQQQLQQKQRRHQQLLQQGQQQHQQLQLQLQQEQQQHAELHTQHAELRQTLQRGSKQQEELRQQLQKEQTQLRQKQKQHEELRQKLDQAQKQLEEFKQAQQQATRSHQQSAQLQQWIPDPRWRDPARYSFDSGAPLGAGAHGTVRAATNQLAGKCVAVKVALCNQAGQPENATRRELMVFEKVWGDRIVSLLDVTYFQDQTRNTPVVGLVMPYMPHNLGGVIYSSNVQWSIPQVKLYAKQLIEALSSLHDQGIIHGDLKPSNILLSANHHLKLTDFGMSESADYPEERRVICSRIYRAPEILLRTPRRTTASDVWSLGVVLAEMLGRRVPWTGATAFDTLQAILYHTGAYSPLFVGADQLPGAYQGSDDDSEQLPLPVGVTKFEERQRRLPHSLANCFGTSRVGDVMHLRDQCLAIDPRLRPKMQTLSQSNALRSSSHIPPALPEGLPAIWGELRAP
ncbi:hypothetical protein V8E36_005861 [Tilletia maclaganii]